MKKIIVLILAIIAIGTGAHAQKNAPTTYLNNSTVRNTYGTQQLYGYNIPYLMNKSGTVVTADTLKGVDTAYFVWHFNVPSRLNFDFTTVQKADSLSGSIFLWLS